MPNGRVTQSIYVFSQAGLLAVAIGSLAAIEIWHSYHQATSAAEQRAQGLVRLMAEQTERTVQAVDLTLVSMRDALLVVPPISANDTAYQAALRDRLKSLPYVRGLFVVGPDGFAAHDTRYPETPRVSLVDRPYFLAHREHPELGLRIGQPLQSRARGLWFVSVTRRIDNADGSFGGVAVAVVEPRYFQSLYEGLQTGDNSVIAIMLRDGTLIARTPDRAGSIGTSYADRPAHRLSMTNDSGVIWAVSPIDGIRRVVSFQVLAGANVVVVVGLAERMVYAPWREHAGIVGGGALLIWILATVLGLLWHRLRLRELQEQARLAQVQRLEMMGRIAGGIAHDLGNTLRVAQSTFTVLKPFLSNQHDALALVSAADHSLNSAFGIIDRLLAFARRRELRPEHTNLRELINGFVPILRQAAGPRIQIQLDAVGAPICQIDPIQLECALLNLVLNARDAMPEGGCIVIGLHAEEALCARKNRHGVRVPSPSWAEIVVRDNGSGMARDVLQRAFDPFFTTKKHGTGLGLSQVLGFVQQSAGEVRLESRQAAGTAVRLLIPATPGRNIDDCAHR